MMKKICFYAVWLLATVSLSSCSDCYENTLLRKDMEELKSRVEKLEAWCNTANSQISALQGLVAALQEHDFVTNVTPIMDGTKEIGYTIAFTKGKPITIMQGKDGVNGITPIVGVAKDADGLYYWTVQTGDAEAIWLLDAEGKKIGTGKDGATPQLSVGKDGDRYYWKVDGAWLMSDGQRVPATGDKGQDGDAIFKKDGIDLTDPNSVTFTLADSQGTKITLPRTGAITIFDDFSTISVTTDSKVIPLALNIKQADYAAIKAEITNSQGTGTAIATRAAGSLWTVKITQKPIFNTDGSIDPAQPAIVELTAPANIPEDIALLKITVIDTKGNEHSATRVAEYKALFANEGDPDIDGSSWEKAYTIARAQQLQFLAARVNSKASGDWARKYYKLTADIDLGGIGNWTPISLDFNSSFHGKFDGCGHTISNLTINSPEDNQGLFGETSNATVKNLNVSGTVKGGRYTGGVIGFSSLSTIENCSFSGTVEGELPVGGVIGCQGSDKNTVMACRNFAKVIGIGEIQSSVGGVIGSAASGITVGCYNMGEVEYTSIKWAYVGGVVGISSSNNFYGCYNIGKVTVTASLIRAGQIAGRTTNGCIADYFAYLTGGSITNPVGTDDGNPGLNFKSGADASALNTQEVCDMLNAGIKYWNNANPDNACNWHYAIGAASPELVASAPN